MYDEKEFRVVSEFKYKGYKYYCLLAKDGDRFFMKDKNGNYDYLVYEEYVEIDRMFKTDGILRNENTYVITYSNKSNNKESIFKKIKTCKLVWRKKILLPLAIAAMLAVGIPTSVSIQRYIFDNNLRVEKFADYGVYLDKLFEFDENTSIQFIKEHAESEEELREFVDSLRTVKLHVIKGVDNGSLPFSSDVLSKENFEHSYLNVSRDEFCQSLGISNVTYNDIYDVIDNSYMDSSNKKLFKEVTKKMEENNPDIDLRLLYYNLKNLNFNDVKEDSEYDEKLGVMVINPYRFDVMNNKFPIIYDIDEEYERALHTLAHEEYHFLNNAYDPNTKLRVTNYIDCVTSVDGKITSIDKDFGMSFEEYNADKHANKLYGIKHEFDSNHIYSILYYSMVEGMLFEEGLENMSFIEFFNRYNEMFDNGIECESNRYEIDNCDYMYLGSDKDMYVNTNIMIESIQNLCDDKISKFIQLLKDKGYSKDEIREKLDKVVLNIRNLIVTDNNIEMDNECITIDEGEAIIEFNFQNVFDEMYDDLDAIFDENIDIGTLKK